jgi:glycosyltransferase involved in cell wall biosynthesis
MASERLSILHVIHDFLPRHQAGSEIYAFELCRELAQRHHVAVLCAEYDPSRPHGHVAWRVYEGLSVIEVVNNWRCGSFEHTYRSPLVTAQIEHVLRAVQPDVVHVHNLMNLSFDLPALARARGIPVVATLHDYALVCPSGGQRIHVAEQHVCDVIDAERCARCFPDSPFHAQLSFARVAGAAPPPLSRAVLALARRHPRLARRFAAASRGVAPFLITPADIRRRLEAAQRIFNEVDLFVAPSPSIASEFEQLGIEPSKIRVSDYGFVSLRRLPAATSRRGPLRIGYAGTLVWHKGVHVLLEAVRHLPAGAYELKVFGSLDVFPEYCHRLRVQSAGLAVRFMGAFERERAADVYEQMDVLVVPSLWLENSPLVIHEAFMAGVPVVGARIGGIPDLLRNGEDGLLYDPASPAELTAILQDLIDGPGRLDSLARRRPAVKPIAADALECEGIYRELLDVRARRTIP